MLTEFLIFFVILLATTLATLAGAAARRRLLRRSLASAPPPLDVRAARRHSHSLGLPFPEADGSVSWPGDGAELPDRLVHDQIHARRALAEAGVTGDEAGRSLADALGLTAGQRVQVAHLRAMVPCAMCGGTALTVGRFTGDDPSPTKILCGDCLAKRS